MSNPLTGVNIVRLAKSCLATLVLILAGQAATADISRLDLPMDLVTYDDGRAPIQQVLGAYADLLEQGWHLDIVTRSKPAGTTEALPIIALRSPQTGPAAWFLTGIHGEEPAGPNAMAAAVDALAELGKSYPVVILPLCNPQGYTRNWRYLNMAVYSEDIEGQSVGDSSHVLQALPPDTGTGVEARAPAPSSHEADAIARYILDLARTYPPRYSIDLHEDNLIDEGYVYSQGVDGAGDVLATEAVSILRQNNIGIKMSGQTRFGEDIVNGIIGPVTDSSIDELMSARQVVVDGKLAEGPGAGTVLVFETPAASVTIEQRIQAHHALLRRLTLLIAASANSSP
jgi:hypothetical protein